MEHSDTKIVIYSKDGCPFCALLKNGLRRRGKEYVEIDLTDDSTRQAFYEETGVNTVPQLFIVRSSDEAMGHRGERLGGWAEVSKSWEKLDF